MKLSDHRLSEILDLLQQGNPVSKVTREEWMSIASELNQLRLRTSAQSRSAAASGNAPASR